MISDPVGDTFGVPPLLDITSFNGDPTAVPGAMVFNVNFAGAIAPPSAFAPNSVTGFIDLDTDRNPATGGSAPFGGPVPGGNSWINYFIQQGAVPGPTIGLGDEFYIDIGSEEFHPGFVDVFKTSTNAITGQAPILFGSNSFKITVPLSDLSGATPPYNFGIVIGNFDSPTDRAPNGTNPAVTFVPVPEPGSMMLFIIALAGAGGYLRQARSRQTCRRSG